MSAFQALCSVLQAPPWIQTKRLPALLQKNIALMADDGEGRGLLTVFGEPQISPVRRDTPHRLPLLSSCGGRWLYLRTFLHTLQMQSHHVRAQSTVCNPVDCSPPDSSLQGILQGRILEWVAVSSSRESFQPRDRTRVSYVSCIGRWVLYH